MQREKLTENLYLCVEEGNRPSADAYFLASFAAPSPKDVACDLCSGCGVVPFLWLRSPGSTPASVTAVELGEREFALLECSARENEIPPEKLTPVRGDLRDLGGSGWAGRFSLVTCNPPYFSEGSGLPAGSRDAARREVSCTLFDVCAAAARLLRYGGRFCLCHRPERLAQVITSLIACRLEPKRLRFVQRSPAHAPWLLLLEARLGGKPGLRVLPPFYQESEEIKTLYGDFYAGNDTILRNEG